MAQEKLTRSTPVIAIGGSAGSLDVLFGILSGLRQDLQLVILIILHRKSDGDSMLSELLNGKTNLRVKDAEEKEAILPGHIYLAPPDYHLLIENDETFSFDYSEKVNYSRPSIDISFESAADVFGARLTGILLSGANADGVIGLRAIKRNGGTTIAQHPDSARVPYMPTQAILHAGIDKMLLPEEIVDFINERGSVIP